MRIWIFDISLGEFSSIEIKDRGRTSNVSDFVAELLQFFTLIHEEPNKNWIFDISHFYF